MRKINSKKLKHLVFVLLFLASIAFCLEIAPIAFSSPPPLVLVEQARQHYQTAQYQEAVKDWQQAAQAFAEQGDSLNQAMAMSNLALSYQPLGEWHQAQLNLTQSLNLLKSLPETPDQQRILASTLDIQGQGQLALGQPTAANDTWQAATIIYQKLGNSEGVSRSLINRAFALQALGLNPRACAILLKTLDRDRPNCNVSPPDLQNLTSPQSIPLQILALRSLGNVLRVMNKNEQSQLVLVKSWQLAQKIEGYQDIAEIYLSLGNTARALGNSQLSTPSQQKSPLTPSIDCIPTETQKTDFYQQAAVCYSQAELSPLLTTKIQAQLNQLSLQIQRQQWAEIPLILPKIQATLPKLTPNHTTINAQLKYIQTLTCLKTALEPTSTQQRSPIVQQCRNQKLTDTQQKVNIEIPSWQEIGQIATTAYQQAQTLADEQAQANALGYLASTYQQQEKWTQAQQLTELALQTLSSLNAPDVSYFWQWQLGQLYKIQGNVKEAQAVYTLAFDNLQALRQDLVSANRDLQFSFRDSVEPVYRELVDLLLQGENPSQENLKQARNTIESLQIAELNNFFQEACLETQPQSIDRLDPHAAVLYSIVLPERLAVILSLPGQPLRYYATTVTSATVELTFDDLFANLNPFIYSPEPLKSHQQFYDWLIRPARAQLEDKGITTLVFVLDGILRNIPMAALHDGQQYLVEQYNLALTPGLQLLRPRSFALDRYNTLLGGLATASQGFSPLPGVKQEVREISTIVDSQVLLNEGFTRKALQKAIKDYSFSIVHLATHGQFSSQAENTFLLTWDERINVKDLDQLLQEPDPIELLILSACQTAVGDKRATLGLAGMAVRARARSTLATLWSVQDQSTADLMTEFYRVFARSSVTKAQALRQAQISLLKMPQYQHPYYWAPFVLVGNWL